MGILSNILGYVSYALIIYGGFHAIKLYKENKEDKGE